MRERGGTPSAGTILHWRRNQQHEPGEFSVWRRSAGSSPARAGRPGQNSLLEIKSRKAALSIAAPFWEHGILAQAFLDMGDASGVILMAKSAMVEKAADGRLAPSRWGNRPRHGGTAYWRAAE